MYLFYGLCSVEAAGTTGLAGGGGQAKLFSLCFVFCVQWRPLGRQTSLVVEDKQGYSVYVLCSVEAAGRQASLVLEDKQGYSVSVYVLCSMAGRQASLVLEDKQGYSVYVLCSVEAAGTTGFAGGGGQARLFSLCFVFSGGRWDGRPRWWWRTSPGRASPPLPSTRRGARKASTDSRSVSSIE